MNLFASAIYLDEKNNVLGVRILTFNSEFDFLQFLHIIDNEDKIEEDESYIKIEIWLQKEFDQSEFVFEKEFLNGEAIKKQPKKLKEGTILNFTFEKRKDKS